MLNRNQKNKSENLLLKRAKLKNIIDFSEYNSFKREKIHIYTDKRSRFKKRLFKFINDLTIAYIFPIWSDICNKTLTK